MRSGCAGPLGCPWEGSPLHDAARVLPTPFVPPACCPKKGSEFDAAQFFWCDVRRGRLSRSDRIHGIWLRTSKVGLAKSAPERRIIVEFQGLGAGVTMNRRLTETCCPPGMTKSLGVVARFTSHKSNTGKVGQGRWPLAVGGARVAQDLCGAGAGISPAVPRARCALAGRRGGHPRDRHGDANGSCFYVGDRCLERGKNSGPGLHFRPCDGGGLCSGCHPHAIAWGRVGAGLASDDARMDPRLGYWHTSAVTTRIEDARRMLMALRTLPPVVEVVVGGAEARGLQRAVVETFALDGFPEALRTVSFRRLRRWRLGATLEEVGSKCGAPSATPPACRTQLPLSADGATLGRPRHDSLETRWRAPFRG